MFFNIFGGAQGRPEVGQKLVQAGPKSDQRWSKVGPKLAQSRPKVGSKSAQSRSKVGPKPAHGRPGAENQAPSLQLCFEIDCARSRGQVGPPMARFGEIRGPPCQLSGQLRPLNRTPQVWGHTQGSFLSILEQFSSDPCPGLTMCSDKEFS